MSRLLLDNSAWARLSAGQVSSERAQEVARLLEDGELAVCLPFLLEAGYSARSGADHEALTSRLRRLPHVAICTDVEARALEAQADLAAASHHRLPPTDLLIAALADRAGLGILHYDHDYDLILEHTALRFNSVWLASRGSL